MPQLIIVHLGASTLLYTYLYLYRLKEGEYLIILESNGICKMQTIFYRYKVLMVSIF